MIQFGFGKNKPQTNAWNNDADEIQPRLFLGGIGASQSEAFIKDKNISHIVSCVPLEDKEGEESGYTLDFEGKF